jgi:beta-phosphoglucomutase family hydrolase
MNRAKAFIFDLNGTMIDDMEYHTIAWQAILNEDLKAGLSREEVRRQMYGKNEELLVRVFGDGHFTPEEVAAISIKKERSYQQAFLPRLRLINGLPEFLDAARTHGIKMGIGTAAIPFNIDFVLDNLAIRHYFQSIVSADDVKISKPHPETFLLAATELDVSPGDCIVFEDAPKGVEAADRAGMRCIVLTTMHDREEFERFSNVIGYIADYTDPLLMSLTADSF